MNRIGVFKIKESFKITGRGRVATGQITEGKVNPGSYAYIQIEKSFPLCKIVGVEFGKADSEGGYFIGLLLKSEELDLLNHPIDEQVIDILQREVN